MGFHPGRGGARPLLRPAGPSGWCVAGEGIGDEFPIHARQEGEAQGWEPCTIMTRGGLGSKTPETSETGDRSRGDHHERVAFRTRRESQEAQVLQAVQVVRQLREPLGEPGEMLELRACSTVSLRRRGSRVAGLDGKSGMEAGRGTGRRGEAEWLASSY